MEKKRSKSLFRSYSISDFLTLGNAACGTVAIFLCVGSGAGGGSKRFFWIIFMLLCTALALDIADGLVARRLKRQSPFGADLDSLADIISFGVAPAVLGFSLGLRSILDTIVLTYFVMCGVSRLARYNVTACELADDSGKVQYFEGTPIPTSIIIVVILAFAFGSGYAGDALLFDSVGTGLLEIHFMTFLYLVSGIAMVSSIRIPKP